MSNTFGERLNELIEDLGMKKVQFAKELDVDQSYVSQMISGKRMPSDRIIKDICRIGGVNREWLCNGILPKKVINASNSLDALADAHNLSQRDREIIKGFFELDETQRNVVLSMLRGLVDKSNME